MPLDILLGRWLAMCAHPARAARVLPPGHRRLLVATYFATSFVAVLTALLIARP